MSDNDEVIIVLKFRKDNQMSFTERKKKGHSFTFQLLVSLQSRNA